MNGKCSSGLKCEPIPGQTVDELWPYLPHHSPEGICKTDPSIKKKKSGRFWSFLFKDGKFLVEVFLHLPFTRSVVYSYIPYGKWR